MLTFSNFFIFLTFFHSFFNTKLLSDHHYEMTNEILTSMEYGKGIRIYDFKTIGSESPQQLCHGISYLKKGTDETEEIEGRIILQDEECTRLFLLIQNFHQQLSNDFFIRRDSYGRKCLTHKKFQTEDCFIVLEHNVE